MKQDAPKNNKNIDKISWKELLGAFEKGTAKKVSGIELTSNGIIVHYS